MKLFEKDRKRFDKYLQQPIETIRETELEVIFGSTENKNPITFPAVPCEACRKCNLKLERYFPPPAPQIRPVRS